MSDNEKPQFESARSTLVLNSQPAASADPMQADEERMRRALGLYGDQQRPRPAPERNDAPAPRPAERFAGMGHHKRRFVHDGEVPVTLVHGLTSNRREHADGNGARGSNGHAAPTNRLEVAEAALAAEIATRERTERALQETQAALHDVQTKLGHAELARQEAVEALRREREAAAELRAALHQAEARVAEAEQARITAEQALAALQDRVADAGVALAEQPPRRRRGRPPRVREAIDSVLADLPDDTVDMIVEAVEPPPRRRGRKPRALVAAEQALAGLDMAIATPRPDDVAETPPDEVAEPADAPAPRRRGRKPQASKPQASKLAGQAAAKTRGRAASRAEASAEPAAPRRRGRKPGMQAATKSAATKTAAAKPRKAATRGRPKKATARDPKPIRWWLSPRGKRKR